jgi:hypothetical protein
MLFGMIGLNILIALLGIVSVYSLIAGFTIPVGFEFWQWISRKKLTECTNFKYIHSCYDVLFGWFGATAGYFLFKLLMILPKN